jgi:hypothetical protein
MGSGMGIWKCVTTRGAAEDFDDDSTTTTMMMCNISEDKDATIARPKAT